VIAAWTSRQLRWLSVAMALLVAWPTAPAGTRLGPWLAVAALFFVLYLILFTERCARWPEIARVSAIAAASAAGLGLVALGDSAFGGTYPVLVAAVAGSILGGSRAVILVAAQSVATALAFIVSGLGPGEAALLAGIFGGLSLFVVYTAQVARAEAAARRALVAAQSELESRSRDAERLRIARELHDVMGHHLTALSLTLEAASHSSGEAQALHTDEALVLTKRLLRDVRQVVSELRDEPDDLERGLRRLAAQSTGPRVHLELAEGRLPVAEPAHALLRCAQEALTNAARHGSAANVWIDLRPRDAGWMLAARDDGHAANASIRPGHGLRGVTERLREVGGRVEWGLNAGGGFELRAWVPGRSEGAA
jgi:signal transduction histidine kinase